MEKLYCTWISDFLTIRWQTLKPQIYIHLCEPRLTTAPPPFTMLMHDCTTTSNTNHIIKFAVDTMVVDYINYGDETAFMMEMESSWQHGVLNKVDVDWLQEGPLSTSPSTNHWWHRYGEGQQHNVPRGVLLAEDLTSSITESPPSWSSSAFIGGPSKVFWPAVSHPGLLIKWPNGTSWTG